MSSPLIDLPFQAQKQLYYGDKRAIKDANYRAFNCNNSRIEFEGAPPQPNTLARQLFLTLPTPYRNANYRRAHWPALASLLSDKLEDRLAIRSVQFYAANFVFINCAETLKRVAEDHATHLTLRHYAALALEIIKPALDIRERHARDEIFPRIIRGQPWTVKNREEDLRTGAWERWTVYFAPWLTFNPEDMPQAPLIDHPELSAVSALVDTCTYALAFMANCAPLAWPSCMHAYANYFTAVMGRNGHGVMLSALNDAIPPCGPLAGQQRHKLHKEKVRVQSKHDLEKRADKREHKLVRKYQFENKLLAIAKVRGEIAEHMRVTYKQRDLGAVAALKEQRLKLIGSPYSAFPLTEAQRVEIQRVLGGYQKAIDSI